MKIRLVSFLSSINTLLAFIALIYCYNLLSLNQIYVNRMLITLTSIVVTLSLIILYKKRLGFHFSYLLYLFLTHYGIFLVNVFTENPFYNSPFKYDWYYFNLTKSQAIVSIFIIIFALFSTLMPKQNKDSLEVSYSKRMSIAVVGYLCIIYFTIYYFILIYLNKINIGENYSEMHSRLGDIPFYELSILIFAVGICFILSVIKFDKLKVFLLIVSMPSFLLLVTGNRGELFYPLLAGLGILILRKFKLNFKIIMLMIMVFFILFPLIKEFRNINNNNYDGRRIDISSSLIEIGYTLRPVSYIVLWDDMREPKGNGISYYVPLQRQVANFLGKERITYENQPYSFRERLPTMGFSVVAEAYYNFRILGMIMIPIIISIILYSLSRSKNIYILSLGTGVLAILINNIRNAFSFVPGHIIFIIIIVFISFILEILLFKRGSSNHD